MRPKLNECRTLPDVLASRRLTMDQAAVLARVDKATISRICSGQARAAPPTIVRLAQVLGISARRMADLCDRPWIDRAQREISDDLEELRGIDIDAIAGTS